MWTVSSSDRSIILTLVETP